MMGEPIWWPHREHRCLRGWLVRRHIRRVRHELALRR